MSGALASASDEELLEATRRHPEAFGVFYSRPTPSTGPTPPARCALGETPPGARSWRRFDERPVRSLTVLGCARLDDGRQLELVVRKFRPRGRCLDVHVMGTASVSECAAGPPLEVPRHSIGVSSFTRPGTAASKRLGGALVVGWATGTIRRAELRPWDGGPGEHHRWR